MLSKSETVGTIRCKEFPKRLGLFKDIEGTTWDVNAIIGKVVCACKKSELHPYFTDTSSASYGYVSQTWKPYNIELA